jgi:hypothetical protein
MWWVMTVTLKISTKMFTTGCGRLFKALFGLFFGLGSVLILRPEGFLNLLRVC